MDKLITGIIIAAVVVFFYWLYQTGGDEAPAVSETATEEMAAESAAEGPWVAVVGVGEEAHVAEPLQQLCGVLSGCCGQGRRKRDSVFLYQSIIR